MAARYHLVHVTGGTVIYDAQARTNYRDDAGNSGPWPRRYAQELADRLNGAPAKPKPARLPVIYDQSSQRSS